MSKFSKYSVLLDGESTQFKRQEIRDYFHNTYELYERVFDVLKDDEVFYKKSEITRHPMIFYFAHTATFFVNKLINMKIIKERINPDFESIFAVGVDEMSWDDMEETRYKWPEVSEVREYRKRVKGLVDELIMTLPLNLPIKENSPMWIILMGIEHERIHIETSLVLHRQMPIELVKDLDLFTPCMQSGDAPKNELLEIGASKIQLGVDKESHKLYGWDNEYGIYEESVEKFKVSKYLVSNGEYLEFVKDGGYENKEFWDEEGQRFLELTGANKPIFWILEKGVYRYRTLTKEIDMPLNWPVDVNALEAEAFCCYKSRKDSLNYSLPSEAEYRAIYDEVGIEDIPMFDDTSANLNFSHYSSSSPVDEFSFTSKSNKSIYDVVGNVWQWSKTPIRGFRGFEVHEAYDDFSVPTFDEKHALILGSSWASSGNLITKYSRYAFRKHFYQNAGFRYVISKAKSETIDEVYESDKLVSHYCEFQYSDEYLGVKNFAISVAKLASSFATTKNKALDLGSKTGRTTYELAKIFDEVEGVDSSTRFIQVCARLKEKEEISFSIEQENGTLLKKKFTLKELGYKELNNRVSFWQGDICNLKPNFKEYDLIMATDIIDDLYNPRQFLEMIENRLNKNGILLISSSSKLIDMISNDKFELLHTQDLEYVLKNRDKKYQHSIVEISIWRKR